MEEERHRKLSKSIEAYLGREEGRRRGRNRKLSKSIEDYLGGGGEGQGEKKKSKFIGIRRSLSRQGARGKGRRRDAGWRER